MLIGTSAPGPSRPPNVGGAHQRGKQCERLPQQAEMGSVPPTDSSSRNFSVGGVHSASRTAVRILKRPPFS